MMKKAMLLGVNLMLILALVACGGGGSNTSNEPKESTTNEKNEGNTAAAPVQLQYWTDDRHDQEYIKEMVAKFNETNGDNIQVE
ncbi:MAG: sugar ABC transporter substrate-binding protein, partial [Paenibacillaceae bacterium]|nr:sugar ABC transporter substrate-binding protein [Paenibacillaceae bacterium]